MKKILATAVITGLIGGNAFAQTNVVSSANVVGYNQITIPSNQFVLVSLDFNLADNSVSNLFATLPVGSTVYLWNPTSQSYLNFSKSSRGGWGTPGTNKIAAGTGAFVALPANTQTNIYFSGDVPTVGTTSVFKVNGFALIAYPYPVDMPFTNTAVAKNSAVGDQVSLWNNGWVSYTKTSRGGWGAGTNAIIKVGQAFFYKSVSNSVAEELKPYDLN